MGKALDRVSPRRLSIVRGLGLGLLTLALGWLAYRAMYGMFDVPDDDGYLLMSLRKFNDGGSLYTDVYSQYGPGVFVLVGSVMRGFGVALTNDGARAVNLVLWLASTLLVGLSLLRLTRRFMVAAAGLLVGFLLLKVDANEPLHPGATIGFLLIAMVAAAVFLLPNRPRAAMATLGALAVALLSIKVNVGIFALLSIGLCCLFTVGSLRRYLVIRVLAAELLVALPFVLLSEHLGDAATLRFAAIVAIGVAGIAIVALRLPAANVPDGRGVLALLAGAFGVLFIVVAVPVLTGTTPHDLVEGWFIRPAKTPEIQWVALLVDPNAWLLGAAGLGGAIAAAALWGRRWPPGGEALLGAGRILAGLAMWVGVSGPIFNLPVELTQGMVVGAPLLWIAVLDPKGATADTSFLRLLIPALAALQFLHAYPMPGSQLYWSSFLLVVVGGICVADGMDQLSGLGRSLRPSWNAWGALAWIAVALFVVWFVLKPLRTWQAQVRATYDANVSLDLPGARAMRVPEAQADQLTGLTTAIQQNCSTFMTLPAMNSLNIFSGLEPPVELAGPWPFFLEGAEQQKIVDEVRHIKGFCVVYKPDLLNFWAGYSGNVVPRRPLVSYMRDDFEVLQNFEGYYLMVPRGSRS